MASLTTLPSSSASSSRKRGRSSSSSTPTKKSGRPKRDLTTVYALVGGSIPELPSRPLHWISAQNLPETKHAIINIPYTPYPYASHSSHGTYHNYSHKDIQSGKNTATFQLEVQHLIKFNTLMKMLSRALQLNTLQLNVKEGEHLYLSPEVSTETKTLWRGKITQLIIYVTLIDEDWRQLEIDEDTYPDYQPDQRNPHFSTISQWISRFPSIDTIIVEANFAAASTNMDNRHRHLNRYVNTLVETMKHISWIIQYHPKRPEMNVKMFELRNVIEHQPATPTTAPSSIAVYSNHGITAKIGVTIHLDMNDFKRYTQDFELFSGHLHDVLQPQPMDVIYIIYGYL